MQNKRKIELFRLLNLLDDTTKNNIFKKKQKS